MGTRLMGKLLLAAALHWRLSLADEDDTEVETCWLDDPLGSQSAWAQQCCRPRPCGREACWAPPTFTYEFCCEEAACRPLPVEEVKRALDAVVESLPNANASVLAFRTAPEAFRAMRRLESEGVQLVAEHQACACAIAYFAAALLWHAEDSPKLATAVGPRWFLFGIEWGNLLVEGWAGIFGWLDRFSAEEGVVPEPAEAELEKRRLDLMEVMRQEQAEAQRLFSIEPQDNISGLLHALRGRGALRRIWKQLRTDLAWRRRGQRCVVAQGEKDRGRWICEPWSYHLSANFSSLLHGHEGFGDGLGASNVAVCVLGAPRTVVKTYPSIRDKVVMALNGDAFIYVPFPGSFTPALEDDLKELGRAVTAIVVPDINRSEFEARVLSELADPRLPMLYGRAKGPWRAPLFRQMGSSMWGYHNQHCCRRMVESFEQQRGWQYEWVVFARAEMYWTQDHPPIQVLHPDYVHIPMGQDNSFYNFNPLKGINDRHAVVPKRYFDSYFNRYESLLDGRAWRYLAKVAEEGWLVNTEQYLLLHLRAHAVPVRRFPPVAFLSHCTEGPQCQHLYKGTSLGKQRWTHTAKYFTELIEARRTSVDDFHYRFRRLQSGWIWMPIRPHAVWIWGMVLKADRAAPLPELEPHELLSVDVVCGLAKHGAISSLRWVFFRRCECHASG